MPRLPLEHLQTVKRRVNVEQAFAQQEEPTSPAVHPLVPLDAVPVLAMARSDLPWEDLGKVARALLLRIDGTRNAMALTSMGDASPRDCAHELATLARRGIVRLASTVRDESLPLEIDLTHL